MIGVERPKGDKTAMITGAKPVTAVGSILVLLVLVFALSYLAIHLLGKGSTQKKRKRSPRKKPLSKKYWRVVEAGSKTKCERIAADLRSKGKRVSVGRMGGEYVAVVYRR